MSEPETLAYIFLKGLYVFGIICGLTPLLLLMAVLFYEWRRAKNGHAAATSEPQALRGLVRAGEQ